MYINLLAHSWYSLTSSSISVDYLIDFAIKNKMKYVSLVDINTMYGTMEFINKAKANNLIPVVGLQITYKEKPLNLIASNYEGYLNLIKISSRINSSFDLELEKFLDHIFIIAKDNYEELKNKAKGYFLETDIAAQECFFSNEDDYESYRLINSIKNNMTISQMLSFNVNRDKYLLTPEQAKNVYNSIQLEALDLLLSECNFELPKEKKIHLAKVNDEYIKSSKLLLQSKCVNNLKDYSNEKKIDIKVYANRLKNELDVINKMGFDDYFLLVNDYVNYAKSNGILVGPGRGSAAGSLVSFLLGITEIDPIENNLIFERFLNVERQSMPDIDVDFMDIDRPKVVDYIFNRYGKTKVAQIVVFQRIKIKTAIRDAARYLEIDKALVNKICKSIKNDNNSFDEEIKHNREFASLAKTNDNIIKLARKLCGLPRQKGLHAAGLVISDVDLWDVIPVEETSSGIMATQYSMEFLEPLGLIKMDILGLTNLTLLAKIINEIKLNQKKIIELKKIPLDDQEVFKNLSLGYTLGIFQLESIGMTSVVKRVKPRNIEDISMISAMYRPGPQQFINAFVEARNNPSKIEVIDEKLKDITNPTCGIIIYQEQVIEMVKRIANYTMAESDIFRRAISKKNEKLFIKAKNDFIEAAVRNGYTKEKAKKIFQHIENFANYGFNHSHSLAYSYISYWLAYLKTHFPLEFYTSLMSYSTASDKYEAYIDEAKKYNIKFVKPDIVISDDVFKINNKKVYFGFNIINGIGVDTISKILEIRKSVGLNNFDNIYKTIGILARSNIGKTKVEILIKAGCFDNLLAKEGKTRFFLLENLDAIYSAAIFMNKDFKFINKPLLKEVEEDEMTKNELKKEQDEILGVKI